MDKKKIDTAPILGMFQGTTLSPSLDWSLTSSTERTTTKTAKIFFTHRLIAAMLLHLLSIGGSEKTSTVE